MKKEQSKMKSKTEVKMARINIPIRSLTHKIVHASQSKRSVYHIRLLENDEDYKWEISYGTENMPILYLTGELSYTDCVTIVLSLNAAIYTGICTGRELERQRVKKGEAGKQEVGKSGKGTE